jgi:hypothetical protein
MNNGWQQISFTGHMGYLMLAERVELIVDSVKQRLRGLWAD